MARALGLAAIVVMALLLLAPTGAHAEERAPVYVAMTEADEHHNPFEQSAPGHCHGEASCSGGLHVVALPCVPRPDTPGLPGPNRRTAAFTEVAPARDPPVPIQLL